MSIRIPCWLEPRKRMQIPQYYSLNHILAEDHFYKGKRIQQLLISDFVERNNLDIAKIRQSVLSCREDTIIGIGVTDSFLRPNPYDFDSLDPGAEIGLQFNGCVIRLETASVLIICFIASGLSCYRRNSTDRYKGDYVNVPIHHLDIDIDELKSFLNAEGLPLPSDIFPDEKNNSSLFENRIHNKKGLKEILSLDEMKTIVVQAQDEAPPANFAYCKAPMKNIQRMIERDVKASGDADAKQINEEQAPCATNIDLKEANNAPATSLASSTKQDFVSIPTSGGTTWDQIKMRYVNDDHIEISYPGIETHSPYSMVDLGMDNKPSLSALFKLFAQQKGHISPNDTVKELKANISNLRKQLTKVFPDIPGKPIANYKSQTGYTCNFTITSASS